MKDISIKFILIISILVPQIFLASASNINDSFNYSNYNNSNNLSEEITKEVIKYFENNFTFSLNSSFSNQDTKSDPNWLYSTISQSSAAIIGIIGAFITLKILMVSGEKKSLSNRKAELELEIENLIKQNDEKQKYCDIIDREDASDDISLFLSDIQIEDFDDFEILWSDYCNFYENDKYYCKGIHKEILNERFSR